MFRFIRTTCQVTNRHFVSLLNLIYLADSDEKQLKNVELALELITEAGCKKAKVRSNDIVNKDVKATLRVIYSIYEKFKMIPV